MIIFHPESGELRSYAKVHGTLPRRPATLLAALLRAPECALDRDELYAACWGSRKRCDCTLNVNVCRLRNALDRAGVPATIRYEYGVYSVDDPAGCLEILRYACPNCGTVIDPVRDHAA